MNNLPFDTVYLSADEVQALEDAYKALKAKFNISLPGADTHINKFEQFNNENEATIAGTFLINHPVNDCNLTFVKIHYLDNIGRVKSNYWKCQAWAFVNLKQDFGRVLIRRETFADKILGLVHPIELKFKDDKVFSDHFYVVTNDQGKATAAMTPDFRKVIIDMMYKDFVIEIINKTLVIRNNQPINTEDTVHLAEFVVRMCSSC